MCFTYIYVFDASPVCVGYSVFSSMGHSDSAQESLNTHDSKVSAAEFVHVPHSCMYGQQITKPLYHV